MHDAAALASLEEVLRASSRVPSPRRKERVTEHLHDKLQQPWFGKNAYIHVIVPQHFNLRVLDVGSQFLEGICLHLPYPIAD